MKIVAISGSPKKNGNTVNLLERALGILESKGFETELISLSDKKIEPCNACMACKGKPECVIKDDFDSIFRKMLDADGIIIGTPVYFGSATPETMALLDRAGYVAKQNGNMFSRKVGGPIIVARRAGHNFTLAQLLLWYMINDMIVPGSTYWNVAFGLTPGEVENDAEALRTIDNFADNIAWLLEKTGGSVKS